MSFALHPNKLNLPPLYLMFTEDDFAPAPGARSHAKKKPADYVPRPKNAFIIFRTLYSKWNATLPRVADPSRPGQPVAISDHRSLSKHAGEAWRCMTEDEKAPYKELADEDKALHRIKHPDYKYSPGERAPSKKVKKGKTEKRSESPPSSVTSENADHSIVDEIVTLHPAARRRSSSCPPTASQSWNSSYQQPIIFDSDNEGAAPVFTNPWSHSHYITDDVVSQAPDVRPLDGHNSWSRRSKDDFSVSYGPLRPFSPTPGLCNSYGEFAKRLSRYDTSIPAFNSSSLSSALMPPPVDSWAPMPLRDVPPEISSSSRWDRRKSRDDLDMHFSGPSAAISRTRRGQDVRKASIDDIGINYGSSARVYEWNQGFNDDINSMRMMHAGYHGHGIQDPGSTISSSASPTSMQDFSALDTFPPYVGQQMQSGYMGMPLANNASPQPVMDLNYVHTPLERTESKLDAPSQYSAYNISTESYAYSEYVHGDDDRAVINHDLPRETTMSPEYTHAMSMSIYQPELDDLCP